MHVVVSSLSIIFPILKCSVLRYILVSGSGIKLLVLGPISTVAFVIVRLSKRVLEVTNKLKLEAPDFNLVVLSSCVKQTTISPYFDCIFGNEHC